MALYKFRIIIIIIIIQSMNPFLANYTGLLPCPNAP